jgi:D-arabinose 1-dehydrogenase-like Zn-dependent alcohol dehydrogenase
MSNIVVAGMKAARVAGPKKGFELVEEEKQAPGPNEVRVKVEACGVCHSDSFTAEGLWPGIEYPRAPGHEIAGVIDAVGPGAGRWKKGARVGIGWDGGHDGTCEACRRGRFINCANLKVPGISYDGGYAEFVVVPVSALARLPEGLDFAEAAPLMCAGVTTFNALRNTSARAGDLVAIQGLGGLGHLGVQFAAKMGFRTVAVGRGRDKETLARALGAHAYLDTEAGDPARALSQMGGARAILATAPSAAAAAALVGGLGVGGELMIIGADPRKMEIGSFDLIGQTRSVRGWAAGSSMDVEDALNFALLAGIRPMIETFPRAEAAKAYERMMSGKARFRAVLV